MNAAGGIYIGLGANLGDPAAQIDAALGRLAAIDGVRVLRRSCLYRSPPWGRADQPPFANAAAELAGALAPAALVRTLLEVERAMGRERVERWGPRTIDLDLLLYRDLRVDEPGCTVPHPGIATRAFVLVPLAELAPHVEVPGLGRVADLLLRLPPVERDTVTPIATAVVADARHGE